MELKMQIEPKMNAPAQGIFTKVKEGLHLDKLAQKTWQAKDLIISVLGFSIAGFLIGFAIKRYSEYVVTVLLVIAVILILHHFDLLMITVNWWRLQELLGLQISEMDGNVVTVCAEWIKTHIAATISFLVGFLLGIKCA